MYIPNHQSVMKTLTCLLICIVSLNLHGQSLVLENEKYLFEKVDSVPALSKKEIYEKARSWTVRNLKSSDSNIELNDPTYSQLTSTGNLTLEEVQLALTCVLTNHNLNFKFTILFKDGRYKVIFDNMMLSNTTVCYQSDGSPPSKNYHEYPLEKLGMSKKKKAKVLLDIEGKLLQLCHDLNQSMSGASSKKDDDW